MCQQKTNKISKIVYNAITVFAVQSAGCQISLKLTSGKATTVEVVNTDYFDVFEYDNFCYLEIQT